MPKTRFTSADVRAMAHEVLHGFQGKRVVNIYDLSEKTYLIKFVGTGDSEKSFLMLESGVRFHKTKYIQTQPQLPSPFAMILRKYLRTKRLEKVDQLAMDRVVDFKFGSGETANHVILELYSSGNLVLTDANYEVLALLRSHQFADEQVLKVGEIYPISCTINLTSLTGGAAAMTSLQTSLEFTIWLRRLCDRIKEEQAASQVDAVETTKNKKKKAAGEASLYLRQVLLHKACPLSFLGPDIIDHCLLSACIDVSMKADSFETKASADSGVQFVEAVRDATTATLSRLEQGGCGYIVLQSAAAKEDSKIMDEFTPMLFKQHEKKSFTEFSSFWEAVDEYFNAIDKQRAEKEQLSRITAAEKKLEKVKRDQQKAIDSLVQHQVYLQNCAMLLEMHAEEVDKVRLVINSALASDMSWPDIEAMVEAEQKKGNPLACRIARLQLEDSKIVLKYASKEVSEDFDSSEDEAFVAKPSRASDFIEVEVDLTISSYANAAKLYSNKKVTQVKEVKTVTASEKVLHAAEEQMKKVVTSKPKSLPGGKLVRKVYWFEKFNWFVTSEGFMAVSGHDLQQTELIVRKFMKSNDILVHADIRGAFPWVVFSKQSKEAESGNLIKVSPLAIQEVGMAVVCRSSAWTAKQLVSAYWVKADQVSKQDATGFTAPIGMFNINGKKHFLPPMPLEMGFGIMFRLDEESAKRHSSDRKMREYDDLESVTSAVMDRFEKYNIDFEDEALEPVQEEQDEEDEGKEEGGVDAQVTDNVADTAGVDLSKAPESVTSDEELENADVEDKKEPGQEPCCEEDREDLLESKPGRHNKGRPEVLDRSSSPTSTIQSSTVRNKKKPLNKKKARRYAEQDEEDVELAMMVLGHASKKSGKTMHDLKEEKSEQKKKQDLKAKQSKAGLSLIKSDWAQMLQKLSPEVRSEIEELVGAGVIEEGSVDPDLIKDLALFPTDVGVAVVHEFRDSKNLSKIVNKSNLFAGIMRTAKKNMSKNKTVTAVMSDLSLVADLDMADAADENDDEQIVNRNDGDFLTEAPLPNDTILFALPVCGPYMSMQRFKYKVKLTPGSLKKGKAIKQVLELLPKVKDTTETERSKINSIAENEMLLAMVGDVKLAAPGLHQQLKHKKQRGQK